MERNMLTTLTATPIWQVLDYLLQNPDLEESDSEIVQKITCAKKSSINVALRRLAELCIVERTARGRMVFNKLLNTPLITYLKITSNLFHIQSTAERIFPFCSKVTLFGSRATGDHTSESDYDVFVVTNHFEKVLAVLKKDSRIQVIMKRPEQMLSFADDEPVLNKEVKKGIMLWEKR